MWPLSLSLQMSSMLTHKPSEPKLTQLSQLESTDQWVPHGHENKSPFNISSHSQPANSQSFQRCCQVGRGPLIFKGFYWNRFGFMWSCWPWLWVDWAGENLQLQNKQQIAFDIYSGSASECDGYQWNWEVGVYLMALLLIETDSIWILNQCSFQ